MTSIPISGLFRKAGELLSEVVEVFELGITLREREVETPPKSEHSAKPEQELPGLNESDDLSTQSAAEATASSPLISDLAPEEPAVRTKTWRVREILESLGEPAHYSLVADEYNSLYPDDHTSESAIHALLSREEHGVVWIGTRGAFGLEDFGAFRPVMNYADAIRTIVSQKYESTHRPVPLAVVFAEVGKYRYAPNSESVKMALDLHPDLRRLTGDAYVPIEEDDEGRTVEDADSTGTLDLGENDEKEQATLPVVADSQLIETKEVDGISRGIRAVEFMEYLGHEVIDERWRRGAVWVIGGEELSALFDEPAFRNLRFQFQSSGWSITGGRPAWRSNDVPQGS